MMTFTSEQLATLRKIAQQATQGEWRAFISPDTGTYAVHTPGDERCGDIIKWPGFDDQKNAENNAEFIAAFNPKLVLTLLDERERNQQYIKRRDQENEEIALTVGRLRVELEGKDSKIANLTAERDALREGEMGDARHSNTRAAADIYFQLVEECEIPAGGSLVEYVDDMREKLEAAEKRIAELEANLVALAAENAGLKSDVPLGAIENGKAFADRLENYQFECEGGNLNMCSDWQEFRRCLEYLSEWAMHSQTEHPATDALLTEVRAQAFNDLCSVFVKDATVAGLDDGDTLTLKEVTEALLHYAEQLRAPE